MSHVIVAVPTYNRAALLGETLQSLVNQSYKDRSIVVVDDGSTDCTAKVVDSVSHAHPGIIEYRYQRNQGEAIAVNNAWRTADCEYFAVVSSDDPMEPDWLREATRFLDARPEVIVGYPDWNVIDENSTIRWVNPVFEYSAVALAAWAYCLPGPGTLIRRAALRSVINLRNPRYQLASDFECWLRLSLMGPFARIPSVLANWRMHEGAATISASRAQIAADIRRAVRHHFARSDLPGVIRRHRRHGTSRAFYVSSDLLFPSRKLQALVYYIGSFLLAPDDPPGLPERLRRVPPVSMMKRMVKKVTWRQ